MKVRKRAKLATPTLEELSITKIPSMRSVQRSEKIKLNKIKKTPKNVSKASKVEQKSLSPEFQLRRS